VIDKFTLNTLGLPSIRGANLESSKCFFTNRLGDFLTLFDRAKISRQPF